MSSDTTEVGNLASVQLYRELPTAGRADIIGFGLVYVTVILAALALPDYQTYLLLLLPAVAFANAIVFLSTIWSVSFRCALLYKAVLNSDLDTATLVCAVPLPHCGSAAVVPLLKRHTDHEGLEYYFDFQRLKYVFDAEKQSFSSLSFPINDPLSTYLNSQGLKTQGVEKARRIFGHNYFDIPLPTFNELMKEHAVAPFFVFQMFCVALWLLDEYWHYALFTGVLLVVFESTVVKKRIKNLEDLRQMRVPPYEVIAFRNHKWVNLLTNELVPGDIVSIPRTAGELVVPCDIVILSGNCVVNEALLTGESVPQIKSGIDEETDFSASLDVKLTHKNNVVFGGTQVILSHNSKLKQFPAIRGGGGGAIGYVARTGFHSSQGELIRTILFATEHVSVNNTESLLFIACLLVFAVIASVYVCIEGLKNEERSRYKLMLNCIMIITSVVPPELPMELSLAVNNSLMALTKLKIFCTEPFRIPFAGATSVCCFDKTGTLTCDDFIVRGVAGLNEEDMMEVTETKDITQESKFVIAGCHSLAYIEGELLGDPLEKAALESLKWTITRDGNAVSTSGKNNSLKILHRYRFSSSLKRMSCVVSLEHLSRPTVRVVSKGAADVMGPRFANPPADYEQTHRHFARNGCRVLALGYKDLGALSASQRGELKHEARDSMETGLTFAGFLILSCPLKADSRSAVRKLLNSSHYVKMITGDHVLTATHVAKSLSIVRDSTLILDISMDGSPLKWTALDDSETFQVDLNNMDGQMEDFRDTWDFCLSGPAMEQLVKRGVDDSILRRVAELTQVFARTSPDQKERILQWLKDAGHTTLMCGDGTNDVGALKQAHVGVALIGQPVPSEEDLQEQEKQEKEEEERKAGKASDKRKEILMKRTRKRVAKAPKTRAQRIKELQAEMEAPAIRLGDASIASPFTSKISSVMSTVHVIRQGRCTLVTTFQMYKILALNCLISAYSMSALSLAGVKFGDSQMTVLGMGVAMYFFFMSRSKPVDELSGRRPHSQIFNLNMFLSIAGQFAIHFGSLVLAVQWASPYQPQDKETLDPDSDFTPNVLNSVVFIISTSTTVATFAANYQGRPFMEGLLENKPFFRSLLATDIMMIFASLELFEPLNDMLELSPLPSVDFKLDLVGLICIDFILAVSYAYLIRLLFPNKTNIKPRPDVSGVEKKEI